MSEIFEMGPCTNGRRGYPRRHSSSIAHCYSCWDGKEPFVFCGKNTYISTCRSWMHMHQFQKHTWELFCSACAYLLQLWMKPMQESRSSLICPAMVIVVIVWCSTGHALQIVGLPQLISEQVRGYIGYPSFVQSQALVYPWLVRLPMGRTFRSHEQYIVILQQPLRRPRGSWTFWRHALSSLWKHNCTFSRRDSKIDRL